ncbi:hypothetical protein Tco_0222788 [Tanacetum coccineum]
MILLQVMTILPSEDIDYVDASPPDAEIVSSEVVEIVIPEVGGIDTDILLTIKDDILSPHSLLSFLEETNTFDNSLLQILKTFCFNSEKRLVVAVPYSFLIYFFPDYERFLRSYEEKSYDFYHEEFADELAHIISPPEYDCFYFKSEPDPCELTSIVDFGIRENVLSTTNVNLPFEDDQSPLWAYVVWIFLSFHTYPVAPSYLLSCGNKDTIFDHGISVYHSIMPSVSHQSGTFMKFNVYPNHLNESPMEILSSTCSPLIISSMGGSGQAK